MRVLILAPAYPHPASPGEGVFNREHALALSQLGIDCTVLVCKPRLPNWLARRWSRYRHLVDLGDGYAEGRVHVSYVRHWQVPGYQAIKWTTLDCVRQVLRKVRERGDSFDLVHAQSVYPVGMAGPRVASALSVPFLVTLHIQDDPELYRGPGAALYREMLERAEAVVAVGTPLERFARTILPAEFAAKATVIPNGVDLEKIRAALTGAPRETAETEFVSVANLWKVKGIDYTLRALAELDRRGMRDWRYTVVGDGPERSALERLARESGLSGRVIFRGAVDHRQALEAIAQSDIFVLPSWNEAFGLVYLEAMACGKPVIGCRGQGAQDIIEEGRTGLLVEPKDISSTVDALASLLRDPARARQMGLAGRRASRNFTWKACAERYAALYAKCTSTYSDSTRAASGSAEKGTGGRLLVNEHG